MLNIILSHRSLVKNQQLAKFADCLKVTSIKSIFFLFDGTC
jgi:hypothetical protein